MSTIPELQIVDEKTISRFSSSVSLPKPNSHKGQNGKLLIIGGSNLFHAASKWSLDVASKFVDMVFYASVPQNAQLVHEAKSEFWNGIVIPIEALDDYVKEADCVLIGPGMERSTETELLASQLLSSYPEKKWVIDAGALQMVSPRLFQKTHIVTPHLGELGVVLQKLSIGVEAADLSNDSDVRDILKLGNKLQEEIKSTVVIKGRADLVISPQGAQSIGGGNAGMTKGGTGDVLSGLIAALYCTNDAMTSSTIGCYVNKKTGEALYNDVGPFFNASDLVETAPKILWELIKQHSH